MKRGSAGSGLDAPPSKFPRPSTDLSNVLIRFLIPCRAAGIMIGKGGENIKKIRSQYNVKLNIPDNRGPERIMTIEGDLQAICNVMKDMSPKLKDIMNAKLSDPKRIMGHAILRRRGRMQGLDQNGLEKDDDENDNMLDYRILVHQSQAGSVIGRGGDRIKELRDKHKMRVIKVYQLVGPLSTDRVVQMVAEPENAINCLKSVVEAVESAPPRGPRDDYDAMNFCEADALKYGGWLSREAAYCLSQGIPIPRPGGMPMNYGMGYPYMMGGQMGPMSGGMGPMPGGMPPMCPGGRGPPPTGRGPPGAAGRGRGPMMGGNQPLSGGPRSAMGGSGGPTPVPPPGAPRGANAPPAGGGIGGYGSASTASAYGNQGGYDSVGGYDSGPIYGGMEPTGQGAYSGPGFGGSPNSGMPPSGGYGGPGYGGGGGGGGPVPRGVGDMASAASGMPSRGGTYGGYGVSNPAHDDAKVSQWYGGWS